MKEPPKREKSLTEDIKTQVLFCVQVAYRDFGVSRQH